MSDRHLARAILPILRRIGPGRYVDLEKALADGTLEAGVVRDLHRALRNAEDEISRQKRRVMQPWR
jgi:hypothetical protein